MMRNECESKARDDFAQAIGTVIDATWVYGYRGEDSIEVRCNPPARVRVIATSDDDIRHWCDDWLDPYWNVETNDPRLDGVRSLWVYGPSYERTAEEVRS